MGNLIYAMMASLDGFISGPDGELDWHLVDEELHGHFNKLFSDRRIVAINRYQEGFAEGPLAAWKAK
jgi:hypothetical protein